MNINLSDLSISFPPRVRGWAYETYKNQEVCITHKPTGIEVRSSKERSTYKNRQECMRLLELRLTEQMGEDITWT